MVFNIYFEKRACKKLRRVIKLCVSRARFRTVSKTETFVTIANWQKMLTIAIKSFIADVDQS